MYSLQLLIVENTDTVLNMFVLAKRSRRKKTWDGFLDGPSVSKDKIPLGGASVTGTSNEKGRQ